MYLVYLTHIFFLDFSTFPIGKERQNVCLDTLEYRDTLHNHSIAMN